MDARKKLFRIKEPYNILASDKFFLQAMKDNCLYQYAHCPAYRKILDSQGFDPKGINTFKDLEDLPFIPTLYFKHHELFSMPKRKMIIKATSSGTSGKRSLIGFDFVSLMRGFDMVKRIFKYHHIWSLKPVRFIIFGFEPNRKNKAAIAKTSFGFTFTAPARSKDYAIRWVDGEYKVDLDNIKKKFIKYARGRTPVRTLGFPAYTYFLLKEMKEEGIKLKLPKGSMMTLGGGWKQFYSEKVDKEDFYQLAKEVLGLDDKQIIEFFGAVEHPILYTDCRYHHFHIPAYGRVIIRDVKTLKPVKDGEIGIINLLTPMVKSMPILSIITDDLGIIHREPCPCGEKSPYLEIIGRVGISDIKTCAVGAEELLRGKSK